MEGQTVKEAQKRVAELRSAIILKANADAKTIRDHLIDKALPAEAEEDAVDNRPLGQQIDNASANLRKKEDKVKNLHNELRKINIALAAAESEEKEARELVEDWKSRLPAAKRTNSRRPTPPSCRRARTSMDCSRLRPTS